VIDTNLGGIVTKTLSNANVTLSAAESQNAILYLTGTLSGNVIITTACQGFTIVNNVTTGAFTVTFQYTGALGPVSVPQGVTSLIATDATNGAYIMSTSTAPGQLAPFAGSTAPAGWLLCYGQAISRTGYPYLFSALSTTYGTGNGTTTFNLPDLRGRSIFGLDNMGGPAAGRLVGSNTGNITAPTTLGSTGGEENHILLAAETAPHLHPITDKQHLHTAGVPTNQGGAGGGGPFLTYIGNTGLAYTGITSTDNSVGGGGSHNNTPPGIVMNWIIKT
jgi:microcystin-dependent protein